MLSSVLSPCFGIIGDSAAGSADETGLRTSHADLVDWLVSAVPVGRGVTVVRQENVAPAIFFGLCVFCRLDCG